MSIVPNGSWDCHAHVIGDPSRYPLSPGRSYDPLTAPLDQYLAMLNRHGIAHGVLVQPSVYGFDNSCLLDALDRAGGRLLGVAVPPPDSTTREFEAMHRRGVRGVRCNLLNPGGLAPETVIGWQPMLRELGWHIELHIAIEAIADLRAFLERFDIPVVIDHMGRPKSYGLDPAAAQPSQLVDLVRAGRCFAKLSAPYRLSAEPPPWRDVAPLARALLAANAAACLWATDWPHTDTEVRFDEDVLFEVLADWCPEADVREKMMVQAPGGLFAPSVGS